jgi:hypothetical protein
LKTSSNSSLGRIFRGLHAKTASGPEPVRMPPSQQKVCVLSEMTLSRIVVVEAATSTPSWSQKRFPVMSRGTPRASRRT